MSMKQRRSYSPPFARSISALSATGQQTEGQCTSESLPYFACTLGPVFAGACGTGAAPDTSSCVGGGFDTTPSCRTGVSAATICISGASQQ